MSKNISIAEGGVARQFTNDKLKINLVGGGTEYYVPESSVQLTTKSVTANGTYKASDVGKYGFSQFSVNVRGGNGSADSSGKPTYTPPSGSTPASGVEPGGSGSAVVGEDEDGNEAVIGVDEDGKLVKTPLPSSIAIVIHPTKMSYNDGESINLEGIIVVAKNADGTLNSSVPRSEITCEPAAAPAGSGEHHGHEESGNLVFSKDGVDVVVSGATSNLRSVFHIHVITGAFYPNFGYFSTVPESGVTARVGNRSYNLSFVSTQIYGTTVYYGSIDISEDIPSGVGENWPQGTMADLITDYYDGGGDSGDTGGTATITLNWARPGDGKVLSTTMEIEVSAASSSTEDDEGGGAGHSF